MEFVLNETLVESLHKELNKRNRKAVNGSFTDTTPAPRAEAVYLQLIPTEIVDLATQKTLHRDSRTSKKSLTIASAQPVAAGSPIPAVANYGRPSGALSETRGAAISANSKRTIAFWISPNPKEYLYGIACFCKSSDTVHLPGGIENSKNELFITDILGWDRKEAIKVKRTTYVRYEKRVTREEIENIDATIEARQEAAEQQTLLTKARIQNTVRISNMHQLVTYTSSGLGSYNLGHTFFFPVDFGYSNGTIYSYFTERYSDWERYGQTRPFTRIRKSECSPLKYLEDGCSQLLENTGCFGKRPHTISLRKMIKHFIVEEEVEKHSQKNEYGLTLLSSEWLVKCLFPKIQFDYINEALSKELKSLKAKLKNLELEQPQQPVSWSVDTTKIADLKREIQDIQPNWLDKTELECLEARFKILSSKSFRKFYQSIFDEANAIIILRSQDTPIKQVPNSLGVQEVTARWCQAVFLTVSLCLQILKTWPDCPVDLLSNNLDRLAAITKTGLINKLVPVRNNEAIVVEWVRKNLKPHTYFSIVNSLEVEKGRTGNTNTELGSFYASNLFTLPVNAEGRPMQILSSLRSMELIDTFDMLTAVLATVSKIDDLAPPPRWRITTFHDYIMKKSWELKGPGEPLPKVLLKEAINLKAESGTKWSFTQPNCSNELAWWGKTVRNCVGSSGYVERVKNKTSFIIFCFVDDKPSITVNLKLQNGRLIVQEIRQPSNRSLDTQTNAEFQILFNQVLEILTKENEDGRNSKSSQQT